MNGIVRFASGGAHHDRLRPLACTLLALLLATGAAWPGAPAYKYRDADGHWVFSDQPPPAGVRGDTLQLADQPETHLHIGAFRYEDGESLQLLGQNDCLCAITLEVTVLRSEVTGLPAGATFRQLIEPRTRRSLVRVALPARDATLDFRWSAALGSPEAMHQPTMPYRVPFGVGSTYTVTQSYPSRLTHDSAETEYAVDFALPDGTPVYASREGVVINARHDSFKGAADPTMMDQANVIEILHADGTIAVYAHLHWDSIRVRIGDRVNRGQYIAASGNTGFSSGPHLHFAVIHNTGDEEVSIPVEFAGLGGRAVSAVDQASITAY